MPIATHAALEAVWGVEYIDGLLAAAGVAAPQKVARLAAALDAGDNLIRQYLSLPDGFDATDPRWPVFHELAVQEAVYWLHKNSIAGATESMHMVASERRDDLEKMRRRQQWPGTMEGHGNAAARPRAQVVASTDAFALSKMGGFI